MNFDNPYSNYTQSLLQKISPTPFFDITQQYGNSGAPAAPAPVTYDPNVNQVPYYQIPTPDLTNSRPTKTPLAPGEHSGTQKLLHALLGSTFGMG